MKMKTLYLVSCSKTKARGRHPAEQLYQSPLFSKSRAYVISQISKSDSWLILSAKHGLVKPRRYLCSYDLTLKQLNATAKKAWALDVLEDLLPLSRRFRQVVVLAGSDYLRHIKPFLELCFDHVEYPLRRKGFGSRLQWLKKETARLERRMT